MADEQKQEQNEELEQDLQSQEVDVEEQNKGKILWKKLLHAYKN